MVQPITDFTAFFADAKQALQEREQLEKRTTMLTGLEKELEASLKTKKKQVSDTITQTVKKRRDEVSKSYDTEIAKLSDEIKKIRSKRGKAKTRGEKDRIADETQGLAADNQDLKRRIREVFKADHVPRLCASHLYYSLYFPKGLKELLTMLVTLVLAFLALPVGIYFLIPNRQIWYLVAIYVADIVLFGGLYIAIGNATKDKHIAALREGRTLRDQIRRNKKEMKRIAKKIRKDKDEEIYNLHDFDDEIAERSAEIEQIEAKKKEALNTFDSVTKSIISDEITGNHQAEIDQLQADLLRTSTDLRETGNTLKTLVLRITDQFEVYTGKEFMTTERLNALEEIITTGQAVNISDAIMIYKSNKNSTKAR